MKNFSIQLYKKENVYNFVHQSLHIHINSFRVFPIEALAHVMVNSIFQVKR